MHPAKLAILKYFGYEHLPIGSPMRAMGFRFWEFAEKMAKKTGDNAEGTTALRKLLEAKDCAIRSVVPEDNLDS